MNIGKTVGYKNKILTSNTDMKTGNNKNINKAVVNHKKLYVPTTEFSGTEGAAHITPKMYLVKSIDKPINDDLVAWHEQTMLLIDIVKCMLQSIMMRN